MHNLLTTLTTLALLLSSASAGNFIGYYGNWYQYSQGSQLDLGTAVASGLTHLNYAFATIAYHPGSDTWYLDLTDPWADVQKPFTKCSWNSGGIDLTSLTCGDPSAGNIALAPYIGAPGACPSGCFNDGGDGSTPRICQSTLSYLTHPGYACGLFDYLLTDQRSKYPNVRFVLSVGGWYDSQYFSVATSPKYLDKFVKSVVAFVKAFGFDGIDYDWEYPTFEHGGNTVLPGGRTPAGTGDDVYDCLLQPCVLSRSNDTVQFSTLITATRAAFDAVDGGVNRFGEKWVVSFAAPAGRDKIGRFDVGSWKEGVSYVNLMTYDMHGAWDSTTNHQAPLYDFTPGADPSTSLSIDTAVTAWIAAGLPASKINLGLPFYARRWSTVPPTNNGLYQPATAPPAALQILNYRDFSTLPDLQAYYDAKSKASYGYSPSARSFVSYDNIQAFSDKAAYVKQKGLGGVMVWALQTDDVGGGLVKGLGVAIGSNTSLPLLVVSTTRTTTSRTATAAASTTTTPITTTTTSPVPAFTLPGRLVGPDEPCGYTVNQACARMICCSSGGVCGTTQQHCDLKGGLCQVKLGYCWSV
ncbi:hypothetical protein HDV00_012189 [Rhizophlyctis rosea]|nr:hypothetical protein HDV00_012189 [Rhizophlyctis rosea]